MITYLNKKYKTRVVDIPPLGEVLISVTSLNNILMLESGNYASEETEQIDEIIFYFVEDNQIDLPKDQLKTLLLSEIR